MGTLPPTSTLPVRSWVSAHNSQVSPPFGEEGDENGETHSMNFVCVEPEVGREVLFKLFSNDPEMLPSVEELKFFVDRHFLACSYCQEAVQAYSEGNVP